MPAVHGSLKDDEFVALHNIATKRGKTVSELVTELALAEIEKSKGVKA